jgi:ATP-binding cassette subfamily B protein
MNYLQMLVWPMMGAGFTVNMLARGAASLGRINQILSEKKHLSMPKKPVHTVGSRSISVRDLTFSYPETEVEVLQDINLDIPEGALVGILGRTGVGKSTLIKLFPRLLDPPPNTVFLGTYDVRDYDLAILRKQFGMVPQDTFLFSATIKENIAYANPDVDEETIRRAAEISTISRDMKEFPRGWDTEVGERGVTLSGGQKQRIAISRALVLDPPVLIFDDALSAVDTESEEYILEDLIEYREGKTNIIISHRISTLKRADLILVMGDGKVVEQGTHQELMQNEGLYHEISNLQQLEEETMDYAERKEWEE